MKIIPFIKKHTGQLSTLLDETENFTCDIESDRLRIVFKETIYFIAGDGLNDKDRMREIAFLLLRISDSDI